MDGKITSFSGKYAFLSNFHPSLVVMPDGIHYPTAEHAFQAQKTTMIMERRLIAHLKTPGQAKRAGRQADLRDDWETVKDKVMLAVVRAKFKDEDLARQLVETGNRELIEGNAWNDVYWGRIWDGLLSRWIGQNQLGVTLMRVRTELSGE